MAEEGVIFYVVRYFIKRILLMIPVILGVITIVFIINSFTPGDPARQLAGTSATEEEVEAVREELGLNDPFLVRYVNYLYNLIFKGDFGTSYTTNQPVGEEIAARFPTTLKLAALCTLWSMLIGIPLGIASAVKRYSWIDNLSMTFALGGVSIPSFWLGLMLIMIFSVKLNWLPAFGVDTIKGWILPVISLSVMSIAQIARTTRSSMLEYVNSDFVRTARAKGQKESVVVFKHIFGNALIPIITIAGGTFGLLLGGAIMLEQVFAIPGLGKYMVDAIKANNYTAVQGGVLYMALVGSIVNLIIDLIYAFVDPRIKATFKAGGVKKRVKKARRIEEGGSV